MEQSMLAMFEEGAERRGTNCEKWDHIVENFGHQDVLPLFVADMDFRAPECVVDAISARAQHGVFGYSLRDEAASCALIQWMQQRHGLSIEKEHIRTSPGVVQSLLYALKAVCSAGDSVAVMPPVYGPFYRMVDNAGMNVRRCPLISTDDGRYAMDLSGFASLCETESIRALLLCSPHNPGGRIWTVGELTELAAICKRHGVRIISDEIHMDFELHGHRHTPILNIPGAEDAILLCSATKTFNLASLRHSTIIAKDKGTLERLDEVLTACGAGEPNLFGELAQKTAYQSGAAWLDGLIEYVEGSEQLVRDFFAEKMPQFSISPLEGTYLLWIDFRALGMPQDKLVRFFCDEARVGLTSGTFFGPEAEGFMRLNLATPRANIREALRRIERAVSAL